MIILIRYDQLVWLDYPVWLFAKISMIIRYEMNYETSKIFPIQIRHERTEAS